MNILKKVLSFFGFYETVVVKSQKVKTKVKDKDKPKDKDKKNKKSSAPTTNVSGDTEFLVKIEEIKKSLTNQSKKRYLSKLLNDYKKMSSTDNKSKLESYISKLK